MSWPSARIVCQIVTADITCIHAHIMCNSKQVCAAFFTCTKSSFRVKWLEAKQMLLLSDNSVGQ